MPPQLKSGGPTPCGVDPSLKRVVAFTSPQKEDRARVMRTRSQAADLLAAPQPEADAAECDEEGAQRSSQEWESRVRERGARADAACPCCGGAADATRCGGAADATRAARASAGLGAAGAGGSGAARALGRARDAAGVAGAAVDRRVAGAVGG